MRGKLMFAAGAAVGFILGTRAGRERYDDIKTSAKKLRENPTVQEASGAVQSQASKLYAQSKDTIASSSVADRLRHPMGAKKEDALDGNGQRMSSNSF
jgi:hypothetical protein